MTFSEKYCKAVSERIVPAQMLVEHLSQYKGKPDTEQVAIKDRLAEEIEATCPYKPGREGGAGERDL